MFAPLTIRTKSKPGTVQRRHAFSSQNARDVAPAGWRPAGRFNGKLSLTTINDPLEAEADRIAEQVVHRSGSEGTGDAGRQSAAGREHKGSDFPSSERLSGRPLEPSLRAYFEPRFGFDFSRVRIFSDEEAAKSAQSIGALAYTAGPNIAFGRGLYRPDTSGGRRLLAHELTHVTQQGSAEATHGGSVKVATGRTPAIQRDTPPATPQQDDPFSIEASYDPVNASRDEVVQALTNYLNKELALQGSRYLAVTERVRSAVRKLFQDNPNIDIEKELSKSGLPGSPLDFAKWVGRQLPDFIPRKHMIHLDVPPVKDVGATSFGGEVKEVIKQKLGEFGKRPQDVGGKPVEAPSNQPTMGSSPGQHILPIPTFSFGGTPRKGPKPNLPQAPLASEQAAIDKIIQALNDDALIPAAAKGTPQAENFASAKELAKDIANKLAAAEAKKQSTVTIEINPDYAHAADLREIFANMENIVQRLAEVLPGGVKDVDEVIITPRREGKKFPARLVVKLHGGHG